MNERIVEMAEEAAEYALLNQSGEALLSEAEGCDEIRVSREFIEKFAELIVRECIDINKQELAFNAFERLFNRYQEHFGVEE